MALHSSQRTSWGHVSLNSWSKSFETLDLK